MDHASLAAHISKYPLQTTLPCIAELCHTNLRDWSIALSYKGNGIPFALLSVLLFNCGTTTLLLQKSTLRVDI